MSIFSLIQKHKSLTSNFFHLSFIRLLNISTKFFLVAYLVRVLGEKTFGLLTWSEAILQYFIVFINFGFNLYGARYIVNYKNDRNMLNKAISTIYIIKGLAFLFSLVLLGVLFYFNSFNANYKILYVLLIATLGDLLFPIWYFQGTEKMKLLSKPVLIAKLLLICVTFFLIGSSEDVLVYTFLFAISQILMGTLGFMTLKKDIGFIFKIPEKSFILEVTKTAKYYLLGNISMLIFNALTIFIIGYYLTMEKVTGFDICLKIVFICILPFEILQAVVLPIITKSQSKTELKKYFILSLILGFAIYCILFFLGDNLLLLFGGENILKYSDTLKKMSLLLLTVPATFILGQCGFVAFGNDKRYNFSLTVVAIIYFIIVVGLILSKTLRFDTIVWLRVFSDYLLFGILVFQAFKTKIFYIKW